MDRRDHHPSLEQHAADQARELERLRTALGDAVDYLKRLPKVPETNRRIRDLEAVISEPPARYCYATREFAWETHAVFSSFIRVTLRLAANHQGRPYLILDSNLPLFARPGKTDIELDPVSSLGLPGRRSMHCSMHWRRRGPSRPTANASTATTRLSLRQRIAALSSRFALF